MLTLQYIYFLQSCFLFRPGLTATVRRSSTMKCWIWNLWWRILMRLQLRVTLVKLKLSTPLQRKLSARTNQNLEVNYMAEKWSGAEEKSEMLPVWWMFIRLFHLNHLHHFYLNNAIVLKHFKPKQHNRIPVRLYDKLPWRQMPIF